MPLHLSPLSYVSFNGTDFKDQRAGSFSESVALAQGTYVTSPKAENVYKDRVKAQAALEAQFTLKNEALLVSEKKADELIANRLAVPTRVIDASLETIDRLRDAVDAYKKLPESEKMKKSSAFERFREGLTYYQNVFEEKTGLLMDDYQQENEQAFETLGYAKELMAKHSPESSSEDKEQLRGAIQQVIRNQKKVVSMLGDIQRYVSIDVSETVGQHKNIIFSFTHRLNTLDREMAEE